MPQSTQAKKALTEQEARGEFFRQMHAAGLEVEELRSQVSAQAEEIFQLKAMNVGLRSERNKSRTEANAALLAHKDVVALASDEHWLFRREATLKFGQRPDGSRILVVRVRGRKIIRIRGQVTTESRTTDLLKQALEIARKRESGRNSPRKFKSKETAERATRPNSRDDPVKERRKAREQAESEQGRNGAKQQENLEADTKADS